MFPSQETLSALATRVRPLHAVAAGCLDDAIEELRWSENERASDVSRRCARECVVEAIYLAARQLRRALPSSFPELAAEVEALIVPQSYECPYCKGSGEQVFSFGKREHRRTCACCLGAKSVSRQRAAELVVEAAVGLRQYGFRSDKVQQLVSAARSIGDAGLVHPWDRALALGPVFKGEAA